MALKKGVICLVMAYSVGYDQESMVYLLRRRITSASSRNTRLITACPIHEIDPAWRFDGVYIYPLLSCITS